MKNVNDECKARVARCCLDLVSDGQVPFSLVLGIFFLSLGPFLATAMPEKEMWEMVKKGGGSTLGTSRLTAMQTWVVFEIPYLSST